MINRALLFSLVIHMLVLLGSTKGDVLLRVAPVRSSGMLVTLLDKEVVRERGAMSASSGGLSPHESEIVSRMPLQRFSSRQMPASAPDLARVGADTRPIPDETAVDADALQQYRLDLARAARRFKHYPELARDRGWEGEVVILVRFELVPDKPVVKLASPSAHPELDAEALALVAAALRSVSLPPSLRGKTMAFSLPLRYSLQDE